jgi:hypothetical protein
MSEKSVKEKLDYAFDLALGLEVPYNQGKLLITSEDADMLFGYSDGLTQKHWANMIDGRCSIAASVAWDIGKAEQQLDNDIVQLERWQ